MNEMSHKLTGLVSGFCREHSEVRLAYLFGSYARNEARPDSDVDIGIVIRLAQAAGRTGPVRH